MRFSDASWLGLVRFGSVPRPVPRPVPAGSRIKRFGSVRPVWFGFLFLPVLYVMYTYSALSKAVLGPTPTAT